jgi:hypothetical protein
VGVDGMAHAPVWIQEVMSKAVVVFLLVLEKLRIANPRSMFWRERIAKLGEGLFNRMRYEREEYSVHRNAGESSGDNRLGT